MKPAYTSLKNRVASYEIEVFNSIGRTRCNPIHAKGAYRSKESLKTDSSRQWMRRRPKFLAPSRAAHYLLARGWILLKSGFGLPPFSASKILSKTINIYKSRFSRNLPEPRLAWSPEVTELTRLFALEKKS